MEKSKNQKNKVRFVVVREFSGEKSMREAFEQLIERQTCEHFEEWRQQRDRKSTRLNSSHITRSRMPSSA